VAAWSVHQRADLCSQHRPVCPWHANHGGRDSKDPGHPILPPWLFRGWAGRKCWPRPAQVSAPSDGRGERARCNPITSHLSHSFPALLLCISAQCSLRFQSVRAYQEPYAISPTSCWGFIALPQHAGHGQVQHISRKLGPRPSPSPINTPDLSLLAILNIESHGHVAQDYRVAIIVSDLRLRHPHLPR